MMTEYTFQKIKQSIASDRMGNKGLYTSFGALADPTRYSIFKTLIIHKGFCVSDLAELVTVSIAAACQHLKYLERQGLVVRKRKGRKVCYEVNYRNEIARSLVQTIHI